MKKVFLQFNKAFTLAEVLITLVIIGVIAAMTIPTAINNYRKQVYVSGLKKVYAELSQATNRIISEEGNPKASIGGWALSSEHIYQMYKKYLIKAKECSNETRCLLADKSMVYEKLHGGNFWTADRTDTRKLILADGTYMVIDSDVSSTCGRNLNPVANDYCTWIGVDINGAKGPNTLGRDFFIFVLRENGVFPLGCDIGDYCDGVNDNKGLGCACKVLTEGAMNY